MVGEGGFTKIVVSLQDLGITRPYRSPTDQDMPCLYHDLHL